MAMLKTLARLRAAENRGELVLCSYCSARLHVLNVSFDHVVPRSSGGSGRLVNLVWCCKTCNVFRGNLSYEEWRGKVQSEKNRNRFQVEYHKKILVSLEKWIAYRDEKGDKLMKKVKADKSFLVGLLNPVCGDAGDSYGDH